AEHLIIQGDRVNVGPALGLTTGSVPAAIMSLSAASQPVLQASPVSEPDWMLLQGPLGLPPFATDLSGRNVWYSPHSLSFLTRPDNGHFFGINNSGKDPSGSVLSIFDLAGRTVQQTNAAAVNMQ